MPGETSSIKPDASTFKRPDPGITWNNKTEESYEKEGFSTRDFAMSQEHVFLSQVDIRRQDIERTVTKIVRLKAIDYSTEKLERKEYLYYYENWEGVNWLGIRIAPVTDHVEGYYYEQLKKTDFDPRTGEPIKYKRAGQREVYYMPFDKKTVNEIIKNSAHSNQENIIYTVKFAAQDWDGKQPNRIGTRFEVPYEQFTSYSFKDLYELNHKPIQLDNNKNLGPVTKTLYK
jgi:hypothetical protein